MGPTPPGFGDTQDAFAAASGGNVTEEFLLTGFGVFGTGDAHIQQDCTVLHLVRFQYVRHTHRGNNHIRLAQHLVKVLGTGVRQGRGGVDFAAGQQQPSGRPR